jgi:long-chain acyl-CoA synthetase
MTGDFSLDDVDSLPAIVRVHGARAPSGHALLWEGTATTWADLDARSSSVANALRAEGVAAGGSVTFPGGDGPQWFEVVFGAAKAGAVFVMGDCAGAFPVDAASYEHWMGACPAEDPGGDGCIELAGGRLLTNRVLARFVRNAASRCGLDDSKVALAHTPLDGVAGVPSVLAALGVGARCVLLRDPSDEEVAQAVERERVTHVLPLEGEQPQLVRSERQRDGVSSTARG